MRGVPDHSPEQPAVPTSDTILVRLPAVIPKTPLPETLVALGREVLELVPRKQRGSLAAYRRVCEGKPLSFSLYPREIYDPTQRTAATRNRPNTIRKTEALASAL